MTHMPIIQDSSGFLLALERMGAAASTARVSCFLAANPANASFENESSILGEPNGEDVIAWQEDISKGSESASRPWSDWEAELNRMESLKQGWNGYEAPAPTTAAIGAARHYLRTVCREGFEPNRVEPSVMGGVGITHRHGNRKVYLEFYNDGTVHSLFSDRSGKMKTMPVPATGDAFQRLTATAKDYLDGRDSA